jgi:hypothetical protein
MNNVKYGIPLKHQRAGCDNYENIDENQGNASDCQENRSVHLPAESDGASSVQRSPRKRSDQDLFRRAVRQ